MKSFYCFLLSILFLTFFAERIWSEPYLNKPVVYFKDNNLVVKIRLKDGIDVDRYHVIEKGFKVQLKFFIKLKKEDNFLFFSGSDTVQIDKGSDKEIENMYFEKTLEYKYVDREFVWYVYNNINGAIIKHKILSSYNWKKNYNLLDNNFFSTPVNFNIPVSRIDYEEDVDYWIEANVKFKVLDIKIQGILSSAYEFETNIIKSNTFQW